MTHPVSRSRRRAPDRSPPVREGAAGADAGSIRAELRRLGAPRRTVRASDVEPMLSGLRERPFSASGWIFEIKYDGYRAIAAREGARARLLSRHGKDATAQYPELQHALTALPFEHLVMDGELVVLDEEGRPSFERLQHRARLRRPTQIGRLARELPALLFLFDLLAFEDFDLRPLPLLQRKALLRRVLPGGGPLHYVDHVEGLGAEVFEQVRRMGLEGVVAKRADSAYVGGRASSWLKLRATRSADLVVVGFKPRGTSKVGELDLAAYEEDGALVYAGSVAYGLTEELRRELRPALESLRRDAPLFQRAPSGPGHCWVEPRLVCEVRYLTWARGGQLRHPAFLRMRDDKRPEECVRPAPTLALAEPRGDGPPPPRPGGRAGRTARRSDASTPPRPGGRPRRA